MSDPRLAVQANKATATGQHKGVPNRLPNSDAEIPGFTNTSKTGEATVSTVALTQVPEQKWIALLGQGVEAWTEYRRTGI